MSGVKNRPRQTSASPVSDPDEWITARAYPPATKEWKSTDNSRPNVARTYNYLLNGKDNYILDQEQGDRILAIYPGAKQLLRENRDFWSASYPTCCLRVSANM